MKKLKVKKMENIHQANSNQRKTGLDVLLPDKIDYKVESINGHKKDHFVMVKVLILEKYIKYFHFVCI